MRKPERGAWKLKTVSAFAAVAITTLTLFFTSGCNAGQAAKDIGDGAADLGRATGGFFADVGGFVYDNTLGHFAPDPNE